MNQVPPPTFPGRLFNPPVFGEEEQRNLLGSPALIKACGDIFDYALQLRNGTVIRFELAELVALDWIHLHLPPDSSKNPTLPCPADRGMNVRLSEIVWVMDSPMGT